MFTPDRQLNPPEFPICDLCGLEHNHYYCPTFEVEIEQVDPDLANDGDKNDNL